MKYLLFPDRPTVFSEMHSFSVAHVPLEGCFYDRIEDSKGGLRGVRFNLLEKLLPNSVFCNFSTDARFCFNLSKSYVDIVFSAADMTMLKTDYLRINITQDFGGESVLKDDHGVLGVCFEI
jgi:hypothetical protein